MDEASGSTPLVAIRGLGKHYIRGDQVIINDGSMILTQGGVIVLNRTGRKDPGILIAPSEMQVGKRWRSAFTNVGAPGQPPARNFYDHRVTALEEVEVPAGRFKAFRVESVGETILPNVAMRLAAIFI